MTELPEPVLDLAFEVRVHIDPALRIGGPSRHEALHVVPITGGTVTGPRLQGEVLPGGEDWYTDRDGVVTLDARYVLRADDGALIAITNRGLWRASAEVTARLDAGEAVSEAEYYYRTSPVFTTESPAHRWLTETVFVGMAREDAGDVCIRFFALA